MLKLVIVGTIVAMSYANERINPHIVAEIKRQTDSWVPYEHHENPLRNYSFYDLLKTMGTYNTAPSKTDYPNSEVVEAPKDFDSRTQWPKLIHPIRNQEKCGSCWAFGASEAFSDRVAIATSGQINDVMSP